MTAGTKDWIDGKDEGIEEATERAAKICEEMAQQAAGSHDYGAPFETVILRKAAARIRGED
jgi:hypothetical protein